MHEVAILLYFLFFFIFLLVYQRILCSCAIWFRAVILILKQLKPFRKIVIVHLHNLLCFHDFVVFLLLSQYYTPQILVIMLSVRFQLVVPEVGGVVQESKKVNPLRIDDVLVCPLCNSSQSIQSQKNTGVVRRYYHTLLHEVRIAEPAVRRCSRHHQHFGMRYQIVDEK